MHTPVRLSADIDGALHAVVATPGHTHAAGVGITPDDLAQPALATLIHRSANASPTFATLVGAHQGITAVFIRATFRRPVGAYGGIYAGFPWETGL